MTFAACIGLLAKMVEGYDVKHILGVPVEARIPRYFALIDRENTTLGDMA